MAFLPAPVTTVEKEGLPMAVGEGTAGSLAVVAGRIGGVPESIRDGIDRLSGKPGSPEAIGTAVAHLAGDGGLRGSRGGSAAGGVHEQQAIGGLNDRLMSVRAVGVLGEVVGRG